LLLLLFAVLQKSHSMKIHTNERWWHDDEWYYCDNTWDRTIQSDFNDGVLLEINRTCCDK